MPFRRTCSISATPRSTTATSIGTRSRPRAATASPGPRLDLHPRRRSSKRSRPSPTATDIEGARVLALLGDSVTTDHISPAGSIKADSPAGRYLQEHASSPRLQLLRRTARQPRVLMRAPRKHPSAKTAPSAAEHRSEALHLPPARRRAARDLRRRDALPAGRRPADRHRGKEYGSAPHATGPPRLAPARHSRRPRESFERIHRSNLVGMGVLPLQFQTVRAPRPSPERNETFSIADFASGSPRRATEDREGHRRRRAVRGARPHRHSDEATYFRHGGILPYVVRRASWTQVDVAGPCWTGPPQASPCAAHVTRWLDGAPRARAW